MFTCTTYCRRPFRVLLLTMLIGAAVAAEGATPTQAAIVCDGVFGAQVFGQSVTVPAGAFCGLIGTDVRGDVVVGAGAQVTTNEAKIRGSFFATGSADAIRIEATEIRGTLDISAGAGRSTIITGSLVRGNVTLTGIAQDSVLLELTEVRGSVTVSGNAVPALTIQTNTIGGALRCADNSPAPVVLGNVVAAGATGQCATG